MAGMGGVAAAGERLRPPPRQGPAPPAGRGAEATPAGPRARTKLGGRKNPSSGPGWGGGESAGSPPAGIKV